ncbi:MAG: FtsK/SpoIIIE domain-containing protein [Desulfosporosinus sp.]|nr:FtsK/SpoIIIE domain-containing protein [Desulfosporosinus sp.]
MKQQSAIEEVRDNIKSLWLHRKGNEARASVQDVIDAKYKEGARPLIIASSKKEDTWTFAIYLPPGTGFLEFQKLTVLFQDATGGSVHIEKHGTVVTMEVMTEELKKSYPYSLFDASEYTKMALPIPIGVSAKGLIVRDIVEYPHLLTAGETNYGKSNQLHVIANSILLHRPDTYLIIIDPKSTEFDYLNEMALVVDEMNKVKSLFRELTERPCTEVQGFTIATGSRDYG